MSRLIELIEQLEDKTEELTTLSRELAEEGEKSNQANIFIMTEDVENTVKQLSDSIHDARQAVEQSNTIKRIRN